MQDIEHDMNDLFQRAAENYPVNPGKGDWESIVKRLNENMEPAPVAVPVRKKKDRGLIVLFFLLVFLFSGWLIYSNIDHNNSDVLAKNTSLQPASTTEQTKDKNDGGQPNSAGSKNYVQRQNNAPTVTGISSISSTQINNHKSDSENGHSQGTDGSQNTQINNGISDAKITSAHSDSYVCGIINDLQVPYIEAKGIGNSQQPGLNDSLMLLTKFKPHFAKRNEIYIGVVAGPDFSKVHSGSFGNAGFEGGILLGFRFSRRLSFETGFSWNKKNYESNGSDFSMKKVESTMPSGMVINDLQSRSSVIEIPTRIKYDVAFRNYHSFFIAGGVSSYILMREMNMYQVTLNGANDKMLGIYKKNNYRAPAVANVSIGYENNITKNLRLRVEPFLKIPLQGMGVGSLPVTSAGLQLGITGRLK